MRMDVAVAVAGESEARRASCLILAQVRCGFVLESLGVFVEASDPRVDFVNAEV